MSHLELSVDVLTLLHFFVWDFTHFTLTGTCHCGVGDFWISRVALSFSIFFLCVTRLVFAYPGLGHSKAKKMNK